MHGRDDTGRDRELQPERRADHDHELTDLDLLAVPDLDRSDVRIDVDDADVGLRVGADEARLIPIAAVVGHHDRIGFCDHVIVRDDVRSALLGSPVCDARSAGGGRHGGVLLGKLALIGLLDAGDVDVDDARHRDRRRSRDGLVAGRLDGDALVGEASTRQHVRCEQIRRDAAARAREQREHERAGDDRPGARSGRCSGCRRERLGGVVGLSRRGRSGFGGGSREVSRILVPCGIGSVVVHLRLFLFDRGRAPSYALSAYQNLSTIKPPQVRSEPSMRSRQVEHTWRLD